MFPGSTSEQSFVQGLYQVALGRTPTAVEVSAWATAAALIGRLAVASQFVSAPEFRSNAIAAIYATVLHRAPDSTGLAGWVNSVLSLHDIRLAILSSTEAMANG
jgi:hypothetical protein